MGIRSDCGEVLVTSGKFLLFLPARPDLKRLGTHYVLFGLLASWLAGMGRYWDTSGAQWWQVAGLGSVAYTIGMAAFLWVLIRPLKPANWSYLAVLAFVGMTAPPAILYVIPVERFADASIARQVNYGFLLVVATWRVALLWTYLRRAARLPIIPAFFALAMPLAAIMVVLGYFQMTATIMEGMSGNRGGPQSPNDAGRFVMRLGMYSFFAFPFLLAGYCVSARKRNEGHEHPPSDSGKALPAESPPLPGTGESS